MATVKSKFKVKNGSNYDIHHLETEVDQVVGLTAKIQEHTLTIKKNGTTVGDFNNSQNVTINLAIPVDAEDVGALPETTDYAANIVAGLSNGILSMQLKDQHGDNIGSAQNINLPLDMFLKSGTVETCTVANTPVNGYNVGDKYLHLIINNGAAQNPELQNIYILVSDLVDQVTIGAATGSGNVITGLTVSGNNIIPQKGITALTAVKTLKTDNTTAQTASDSEAINGTGVISLHKISKTGNYADLISKPTIPTVGTLKTNNATAQTENASESLSGTVNLHKIAKTGTYSDLIAKPTIPTVGTLNTNNTTAQTANASESLGGAVALHKIAKTGTYADLIAKPTIPNIAVQTTQPTQPNNNDIWLDTTA